MWVRETATGIGTVTFISPETGAFGALGHGVCDSETGSLVPMSRGTVTEVELSEIVKGEKGTPGELRGYLTERKIGSVLTNTDCGVFGVFTKVPGSGTPIPVGSSGEVKTGKASVLCASDGGEVKEYGIDITEIRRQGQTKSFTIKVTDPELLAKTGGIVQGMSGSPILQNGKLVGAVTHVLVNDPTSGYGIFIESMLSVMPETLAPAA
ncbi:MAG: hypothetical protein MJ078_06220 [Clostridia bacterium]|nr:hypothetical protein [Clostridia bacterium]